VSITKFNIDPPGASCLIGKEYLSAFVNSKLFKSGVVVYSPNLVSKRLTVAFVSSRFSWTESKFSALGTL
jgi:hypothetical protein